MSKYLLNIAKGTIHNGECPCSAGRQIKEANRKWFDKYEEAVNYYEGNNRKGQPCGRCLKYMEK